MGRTYVTQVLKSFQKKSKIRMSYLCSRKDSSLHNSAANRQNMLFIKLDSSLSVCNCLFIGCLQFVVHIIPRPLLRNGGDLAGGSRAWGWAKRWRKLGQLSAKNNAGQALEAEDRDKTYIQREFRQASCLLPIEDEFQDTDSFHIIIVDSHIYQINFSVLSFCFLL